MVNPYNVQKSGKIKLETIKRINYNMEVCVNENGKSLQKSTLN